MILTRLKQARLSVAGVTIIFVHDDDEYELTGAVQELTDWTVVLKLQNGVDHIPLKDVISVEMSR